MPSRAEFPPQTPGADAAGIGLRAADPANGLKQRSDRIYFPLLVAAILGVILIMGILGQALIHQFRFIQLHSASQAGSVYVEGFLAPHARTFVEVGSFPPDMQQETDELLHRLPAARHFDGLKIWAMDGKLIFTTLEPDRVKSDDMEDLKRAAAGDLVMELSEAGEEDAFQGPVLEIYSPITDPGTGRIVAVGEIYQDATNLLAERILIERSIWIAIGFTTFGMLGLLLLLASQRRELEHRFLLEQRASTENRRLRQEADSARIAAGEANERLLNSVGAELHDGPIQVVSLLILASGNDRVLPASKETLLSRVLSDLRNISSGLILPEIQDLTLEQTLRLAIQRHHSLTGSEVQDHIGPLPETVGKPLRICLYRAVQEGLNNGWRHASGRGQEVEARLDGDSIAVIVRDAGPSADAAPDRTDSSGPGRRHVHLGHAGIRNRLEVFGGTLTFRTLPSGGTELEVRVPWGRPGQ